MLAAVLLPLLGGALLFFGHITEPVKRMCLAGGAVLGTSVLVLLMLIKRPEGTLTFFAITQNVYLALRMDSLSAVFAGLIALLWPLSVFYAFGYMEKDKRRNSFFGWYVLCYGVFMSFLPW